MVAIIKSVAALWLSESFSKFSTVQPGSNG